MVETILTPIDLIALTCRVNRYFGEAERRRIYIHVTRGEMDALKEFERQHTTITSAAHAEHQTAMKVDEHLVDGIRVTADLA